MRSSPVIQYFPIFPEKRKRVIPASVLTAYNARLVKVDQDQILCEEGRQPLEFFQVAEGKGKMYVRDPDGQESAQGIFAPGETFAEPPLLGDFPYPSSAITLEAGKIWRMPKADVLQLLRGTFDIHMTLDQVLCRRLPYKCMIPTTGSSYRPEHRLL